MNALSKTLDKHALVVSDMILHATVHPAHWFTAERHRCACERRLKKAVRGRGDLVAAANAAFKDATAIYLNLLTSSRELFMQLSC